MERLIIVNEAGDEFILIRANIGSLSILEKMLWGKSWGSSQSILEVVTQNGSSMRVLGLSVESLQDIVNWWET